MKPGRFQPNKPHARAGLLNRAAGRAGLLAITNPTRLPEAEPSWALSRPNSPFSPVKPLALSLFFFWFTLHAGPTCKSLV